MQAEEQYRGPGLALTREVLRVRQRVVEAGGQAGWVEHDVGPRGVAVRYLQHYARGAMAGERRVQGEALIMELGGAALGDAESGGREEGGVEKLPTGLPPRRGAWRAVTQGGSTHRGPGGADRARGDLCGDGEGGGREGGGGVQRRDGLHAARSHAAAGAAGCDGQHSTPGQQRTEGPRPAAVPHGSNLGGGGTSTDVRARLGTVSCIMIAVLDWLQPPGEAESAIIAALNSRDAAVLDHCVSMYGWLRRACAGGNAQQARTLVQGVFKVVV
ncbi:MAG: hypothetical protein WDW36_000071 [Sanguina aurantia]